MALDPGEVAAAESAQRAAAEDASDHVQVVAGPGTGKSQTIEKRVCWLVANGVKPSAIAGVSFTRASSRDLGERIHRALQSSGHDGDGVAVTTLHALALRVLRRSGVLAAYPTDPVVLEPWELENIFDAEFGTACGVGRKVRREDIRRDHEAFWCTGEFEPPDHLPPDPPISDEERDSFRRFHGPRTQLYSCVLPGELVARCVERMDAGTLDPVEILGISDLIVDEFQDLNPMDLRFVHGLAERGVRLFVVGDDDQSLYAFRHATPSGIQSFAELRAGTGAHELIHCFRSVPTVVDAAQTLIKANASDGRLPKHLVSLWATAAPPVSGAVTALRFASDRAEATSLADSCQALIDAGIQPNEIMVLLASARSQRSLIEGALTDRDVPFAPVREAGVVDTEAGRAGYALMSVVVNPQNYVAHRTLLGVRKGVGVGTCNAIATATIAAGRNFRDLFYAPLPEGLLTAAARRAVERTSDLLARIVDWAGEDELSAHVDELCEMVDEIRGEDGAADGLRSVLADLPPEISLAEAHEFLSASNDEDRRKVLHAVAERLGESPPEDSFVPRRVQILTMHGAKGLSAQVVFIPGLEDQILPGEKRRPFPGLVLEAARMLYVALTRARVACILSYAQNRFVNGAPTRPTPSRFTSSVGVTFRFASSGIGTAESVSIADAAAEMSRPTP